MGKVGGSAASVVANVASLLFLLNLVVTWLATGAAGRASVTQPSGENTYPVGILGRGTVYVDRVTGVYLHEVALPAGLGLFAIAFGMRIVAMRSKRSETRRSNAKRSRRR
jgi:hypothetical protein